MVAVPLRPFRSTSISPNRCGLTEKILPLGSMGSMPSTPWEIAMTGAAPAPAWHRLQPYLRLCMLNSWVRFADNDSPGRSGGDTDLPPVSLSWIFHGARH